MKAYRLRKRQEIESIWMEDEFPAEGKLHASPGPTQFVTASEENKVYTGQKAVKRTDDGLAQEVWDNAKKPLRLPNEGKVFAYVWMDPTNTQINHAAVLQEWLGSSRSLGRLRCDFLGRCRHYAAREHGRAASDWAMVYDWKCHSRKLAWPQATS